MDISIVIVSYNTREMLHACLRALPAATERLKIETFVVDNVSSDGTVAMVAAEYPEVRLIANDTNAGFTRANNQALALSTGRYVLLLNPDTEAEPGALTTLVRFLDTHADAGACGPKLLNSDGSLQPNGRRFPTPWREFLIVSGLRNLNRAKFDRVLEFGRDDFDTECEVDQVTGACLLVRRVVMEQVGMLDEDFFMFYEEVEWCWRIRRAGWKIFYLPQARVVHHCMGSVRPVLRAMTARLFRSQRIYFRKTAGLPSRLFIDGIMLAGLVKNELLFLGVAIKRRLRAAKLIR